MNELQFFKAFGFYELRFAHDRHNDLTGGSPAHFLGCLSVGQATLVSADVRLEAAPGELFYIPKGCRYHSYWRGEGEIRFYSIRFPAFPSERTGGYRLQKLPLDAEGSRLFAALTADLRVTTATIGLLYSLLGRLEPAMAVQADRARSRTVAAAMAYMREHPTARMDAVANACRVSETTLYLAFRNELHRTPNAVRQELQCRAAEDLLRTTELSVEEISDRVGFSSSSYFRKTLRAVTQKTPRQIRSEARLI